LKILITGGFGFLGGRIAQFFVSEGHKVFIGTSRNVDSQDILFAGADVVHTPWNNLEKLDEACVDIDIIIHASGMNAKDCYDDPVAALSINVVATANILQSAINNNVKRFLYISTIHVYTDKLYGKIAEVDCPSNLHPYASSHRAAEDVVLWAQENKLIDSIVVRISNGFGVPIRVNTNCWMLLINDLCRQAVEHKQLVLTSNGIQVRNFIPISEICSAINFLVCQLPFEERVGQSGPINVGGKDSLSVLEMAKLIQLRCGAILSYTPDLVVRKQNDSEALTQLDFQMNRLKDLGYSHVHHLTEELDRLLMYCNDSFSESE